MEWSHRQPRLTELRQWIDYSQLWFAGQLVELAKNLMDWYLSNENPNIIFVRIIDGNIIYIYIYYNIVYIYIYIYMYIYLFIIFLYL